MSALTGMRFELQSLLIATVACAVVFMTVLGNGQMGIFFCLPHAACMMVYFSLKRRGKKNLAFSICAAYLAVWLFTATVGTYLVRSGIERKFQSRNVQNLQVLALSKGLVINSGQLPLEVDLEVPWYFCDRISAPCPCVVALDYGYMSENSGAGSRIYLLWFFVIMSELKSDFQWSIN